MKIYKYIS